MSIGGPWSVKGIDPRARARAKTAARRLGITLGEWLNRAILEDTDSTNPQWDDALSAFPGFGGNAATNEEEDHLLRGMVTRLGERVEAAEGLSGKTLTDLNTAIQKLADRIRASDQLNAGGKKEIKASLVDTQASLVDTKTSLADTKTGIERVQRHQATLAERIKSLEKSGKKAGSGDTFSAETAQAVETTMAKLARRLYENEHDVAARLHDAETNVREFGEQTRKATDSLENRLERMEGRASDFGELNKRREQRATEAMSGLQTVTEALRDRVEKADRSATDAGRAVETSVTLLDGRLHALETRNAGDNVDLERRLDRLTDDVAAAISDTRSQIVTAHSETASQPRVDRLEAALTQAAHRADEADRRQGENLSRIGAQISQLATAMDKRVTESEQRTLEAAQTSRAEEQLERRLETTRKDNKRAMLRMGEEVTRLGRGLADRILRSEERSSEVVAAATAKMTEVVGQLEKTRGAREQDLDERLLKSEARTAERIEKAMTGVQERLSSMRDDAEEAMTPVERAMSALADRLEIIEKSTSEDTAPSGDETAKTDTDETLDPVIDFDTPLGPPPQAETPMGVAGDVESDPFLIQNRDAPITMPVVALDAPTLRKRDRPAPTPTPTPILASEPTPAPARAARHADEIDPVSPNAPVRRTMPAPTPQMAAPAPEMAAPAPQPIPVPVRTRPPVRPGVRHETIQKHAPATHRAGATADVDFLAAARERTRISNSAEFDETSRPGGKGRWLIGTSITGASIALIVLIYSVYTGAFGDDMTSAADSNNTNLVAQLEADLAANTTLPANPAAQPSAEPAASTASPTDNNPPAQSADPVSATQEPSSAVVTEPAATLVADAGNTFVPAPTPVTEPIASPVSNNEPRTLESAASDGDPIARYQLGLRRLSLGDAVGGTILLRRAAEQGIPAAQYRYAKQLTSGQGVEINLEAARRWTERAANSGHRMAMQELAIMYLYGTGVAQDRAAAARWFEEAALLGLSDSQFNLAVLFAEGNGVVQSLPDAYAWYSIVAAGGDAVAAQRAAELIDRLPDEALAQAQAAATEFRAHTMSDEANGIYQDQPWNSNTAAISPSIQRAQGFLSVLGYGPGPIDGMMGERTRQAIMSFQSDNELLPTGRVDPTLLERLQLAATS